MSIKFTWTKNDTTKVVKIQDAYSASDLTARLDMGDVVRSKVPVATDGKAIAGIDAALETLAGHIATDTGNGSTWSVSTLKQARLVSAVWTSADRAKYAGVRMSFRTLKDVALKATKYSIKGTEGEKVSALTIVRTWLDGGKVTRVTGANLDELFIKVTGKPFYATGSGGNVKTDDTKTDDTKTDDTKTPTLAGPESYVRLVTQAIDNLGKVQDGLSAHKEELSLASKKLATILAGLGK